MNGIEREKERKRKSLTNFLRIVEYLVESILAATAAAIGALVVAVVGAVN